MKDNFTIPTPSPGRRAASYWFVDGLPQIVLGLALLASGASGLLWHAFVPGALAHYLMLATGFVLYAFAGRDVIEFLKSRITYPRTGYVQPPEELKGPVGETLTTLSLEPHPGPNENVTLFERRTVMVILFFLVARMDGSANWLLPAVLAALAATLYVANRKSEHPYQWWSALVLALMGSVFLWVGVPPLLQPPLSFLLVGLWLEVEGGSTLIRYLRGNPYPRLPEGARI